MTHNMILAILWTVWAIAVYVSDIYSGRPIDPMFGVAIICGTVWAASL